MIGFIVFTIALVCVAYILGLRYGIRHERPRAYRQGRWDGMEEGYSDAIDDGWANGNGSPQRGPQGRFYNQAEEGL